MKQYKEVNGTFYDINTPQNIVNILEKAREQKFRIILDYGDTATGQSWGEIHDITGYIGRSTGKIKIPILVHNSRSFGGGGILDNCIVKISLSKGKAVLYQHPNYKPAN